MFVIIRKLQPGYKINKIIWWLIIIIFISCKINNYKK